MSVGKNYEAALRLIISDLGGIQHSMVEERVGDRKYRWEIYSVPSAKFPRLIALQSIFTHDHHEKYGIEHFEVWMPMVNTNSMDDTLDAIRLYRDCTVEDSSWLRVLRALRTRTAAIKDVLLGKPLDYVGNRNDDGIDDMLSNGIGHEHRHWLLIGSVRRWSEVLQLALRGEYKEPGS